MNLGNLPYQVYTDRERALITGQCYDGNHF